MRKILIRILWNFFLKQIAFLENLPAKFIEFEFSMNAPNMVEDYLSKFTDTNEEYILSIEDLFKNDESVIQIKKKLSIISHLIHKMLFFQQMKI